MELTWKDPPRRGASAGRVDWSAVADELRARPGTWAVVRSAVGTGAARVLCARLRSGGANGWAAGEFEATTRRCGEGEQTDVFARYVGPVRAETAGA